MKIFSTSAVSTSQGRRIFPLLQGKFTQIPQPCQTLTFRPRGREASTLRGINEKATGSLKKYHERCTK